MSIINKLIWLVFIMLLGCIGWFVFVDMTRSASNAYQGLECVYNCAGLDRIYQ